LSSKLESADLEAEDLSKVILACEAKVYETFFGPKPDVEALQKLPLPDYLYIQAKGVIWTREENLTSLKSGVVFSSIEIKNPQVRKLSPTFSCDRRARSYRSCSRRTGPLYGNLTSSVWVQRDGKWLAQLHTSTTAAQG
jgi:Domain of unknown function (DUF4440)